MAIMTEYAAGAVDTPEEASISSSASTTTSSSSSNNASSGSSTTSQSSTKTESTSSAIEQIRDTASNTDSSASIESASDKVAATNAGSTTESGTTKDNTSPTATPSTTDESSTTSSNNSNNDEFSASGANSGAGASEINLQTDKFAEAASDISGSTNNLSYVRNKLNNIMNMSEELDLSDVQELANDLSAVSSVETDVQGISGDLSAIQTTLGLVDPNFGSVSTWFDNSYFDNLGTEEEPTDVDTSNKMTNKTEENEEKGLLEGIVETVSNKLDEWGNIIIEDKASRESADAAVQEVYDEAILNAYNAISGNGDKESIDEILPVEKTSTGEVKRMETVPIKTTLEPSSPLNPIDLPSIKDDNTGVQSKDSINPAFGALFDMVPPSTDGLGVPRQDNLPRDIPDTSNSFDTPTNNWNGTKLTAPMGRNNDGPSGSETWYPDAPVGALNFMIEKGFTDLEMSIRDDGVRILSGTRPTGEKFENLVVVAADVQHPINPDATYQRGDVVETSLGTGIVVDFCEQAMGERKYSGNNLFDIATAWGDGGKYEAIAYSDKPTVEVANVETEKTGSNESGISPATSEDTNITNDTVVNAPKMNELNFKTPFYETGDKIKELQALSATASEVETKNTENSDTIFNKKTNGESMSVDPLTVIEPDDIITTDEEKSFFENIAEKLEKANNIITEDKSSREAADAAVKAVQDGWVLNAFGLNGNNDKISTEPSLPVDDVVIDETEPVSVVPKETIPKETIPKETVPKETIPKETIPKETIPDVKDSPDDESLQVDFDNDSYNSNLKPKNNSDISHRGYTPGNIYDNSAEGFILAGKSGFWGCEADIRFDLDGNLVCSHNTVIQGQNPTSFEEYLDICKEYGMTAIIDLKYEKGVGPADPNLSPAILETIQEKGMLDSCILQTNNYTDIPYIRENSENARIWYLTDVISDDNLKLIEENNVECVNISSSDNSGYKIKKLTETGVDVCVWNVQTESTKEKMLNNGAKYVMSDNVLGITPYQQGETDFNGVYS